LRATINKDLGFDDASRKENIRRTAELAKLFYDNGFVVLVSLISPFAADRALAKSLFPNGDFYEIFVDTDLQTCEKRDVKGLYRKARAQAIASFTGISSSYEPPTNPDLHIIANNIDNLESNVTQILQLLETKMQKDITKILIYGYGWAGKSMLEFFSARNLRGGGGFAVDVYDANFSPFIRDSRALRSLAAPNSYDFILVCITNDSAATSARDSLIAQGVAPDKVKHINAYGYTTEHESQFYAYDNRAILEKLTNDTFEAKSFAKFIDSNITKKHENPHFGVFEFQRSLRHALHDDARELESTLVEYYKTQPDKFPIISVAFSLGRSGTTVMTQWLASLGISCYPTNLLKPYFDTPILGFKNMLAISQTMQANIKNPYTSNFGETEEMFDTLEYSVSAHVMGASFYCFDALFSIPYHSLQYIAATYRGIMDTAQKPLSLKTMPFEANILENVFNNTLYLVLSRDVYTHTLALLNLYQQRTHTMRGYKNYAPKNLDFAKEPLAYAAATLKNALAHRDRMLRNVPESRKIHISYEDFCRNPKALFATLLERLAALDYTPSDTTYKGVESFTISPRNPSKEERAIVDSVFANDDYNVFV
ncbi:MAG: adenylyl-sulfate kinase, partial [Helicobacter sp.]|nr:adenylyl-sulfate kinase [Helicobacter sp.]